MSMWGGGIPPPRPPSATKAPVAPPSHAPPTSTAGAGAVTKSAKFRNDSRQYELETLRQKGLAKLLNRHFTSVTQSIAEERSAAEAALKDLEERKAQTTEFVENTSGGTLSMYDTMYRDLQQKKSALKKKERETLLLYQRYVDKFGQTGAVTVPSVSMNYKFIGGGYHPMPPTRNAMSQQQGGAPYVPEPRSTSKKIKQMTGTIESNIMKNVASGADKLPSVEIMGIDGTYQQQTKQEDRHVYEMSMRSLEAKGVDVKYDLERARKEVAATKLGDSPAEPMPSEAPTSSSRQQPPTSSILLSNTPNSQRSATPTVTEATIDDDEDYEDDDLVSALTDVNSQIMSVAEERLLDFLRTETASIRCMMEHEEIGSNSTRNTSMTTSNNDNDDQPSYSTSMVGSESAQAADKAEEMVRQMEQMLASYGTNNGGASSVPTTPLRKSSTSGEGTSKSTKSPPHDDYPYTLETNHPNEDWEVLWDPNHEREYYHEKTSNHVQWEKPMIHCHEDNDDDNYVPTSDFTSKNLFSHMDYMPENNMNSNYHNGGMSRRDVYRLKQRRRRRRRIIMGVAMLLATLTLVAYGYHKHETDPQFRTKVQHAMTSTTAYLGISPQYLPKSVVMFVPTPTPDDRILTKEQEEKIRQETERRVLEDLERKEKAKLAKLEADRVAKEAREHAKKLAAAAAKEQEQAKRKAAAEKAEADRLAAIAKKVAAEQEAAAAAARQKKKLEAQKREEERLLKKQQEEDRRRRKAEERQRRALQRPWHCNVPLTYVINARCRKLSKANPIFNLHELVQVMMQ